MLTAGLTVRALSPAQWDAALPDFAERTVYHTSAWLESMRAAYGQRPLYVGAFEGTRLVGVWPCLEQRKGPFRILGSPLPGTSTAYLGPLVREDADVQAVLAAFLRDRTLGRYSFFACRAMDGTRAIDLAAYGFTRLQRFDTYLLDSTQSEAALWRGMKGECRNRVRKAEKHGYEVRMDEGPEFLDDFWSISVEVFAKTGIQPTYTRQFAAEMWQRLAAAGRIVVLSALDGARRAACLVLPHDDRTMYFWAGGARADDAQRGVNNLLQWAGIREGRRRGLQTYDFLATVGGPGRFKKTFGPEVRYVATWWEHSANGMIRWLRNRYERRQRRQRRAARPREAQVCEAGRGG